MADSTLQEGTSAVTDTPGNSINPRSRPKPKKPDFNLRTFMKSADSLVTVMAGQPMRLRYVISTRLDTTKGNFTALQPSKAEKIQHYRFLANKGKGKWDIGVVRMSYKAGSDLAEAYTASSRKVENDKGNSNNYIYKSADELVWLYTGCAYSNVRMGELRDNLLRDLNIGEITTSTSEFCK